MSERIWYDVAPDSDAPEGTLLEVEADARLALLARSGGEWLAVSGDCTHDECPLVDGDFANGAIECMCHGAMFDLRTGLVLSPPATEPLEVYAVKSEDGRLHVSLDLLD